MNKIKSSIFPRYYSETCYEWCGPSSGLSARATQFQAPKERRSGDEPLALPSDLTLVRFQIKILLSCARSGVRIPGRSNRTQCCQWLATAATFLRSSKELVFGVQRSGTCVSQAVEKGPTALHPLHRNNASVIKL